MTATVAARPVIIETPAAVAEADEIAASWETRHDHLACYAADLRTQIAALQEFLYLAEEQAFSAGLHMDTARKNAGLARTQAGVVRTASGYVRAGSAS